MTELSGVIYDGHQGPLTASGSPCVVVRDDASGPAIRVFDGGAICLR